jgi:hypothetical protein
LIAVTARIGVVELELLLQLKIMPDDRPQKRVNSDMSSFMFKKDIVVENKDTIV